MRATTFGKTGPSVSALGLGGEGVLRTFGRDAEAQAVITSAARAGIRYFDTARAYAGSERYYGKTWRAHPALLQPAGAERSFLTSKSAERDEAGAWADLEGTLATLGVGSLDLWQIHDVRSERELTGICRRGGALAAFVRAKEQGKVRHIGVTGHHDARVLEKAVRELPVDSVLLPVNAAEACLGGFTDRVIGAARERGAAVVAMKVMGQGVMMEAGLSPDECLRFALAQDVDVVIVGCSSPEEVRANALAAAAPKMDAEEARALVLRVRPHARSLAYYRGTVPAEGPRDPFERLAQTHRRMEERLAALEQAADMCSVEEEKYTALGTLREVVAFFSSRRAPPRRRGALALPAPPRDAGIRRARGHARGAAPRARRCVRGARLRRAHVQGR